MAKQSNKPSNPSSKPKSPVNYPGIPGQTGRQKAAELRPRLPKPPKK